MVVMLNHLTSSKLPDYVFREGQERPYLKKNKRKRKKPKLIDHNSDAKDATPDKKSKPSMENIARNEENLIS